MCSLKYGRIFSGAKVSILTKYLLFLFSQVNFFLLAFWWLLVAKFCTLPLAVKTLIHVGAGVLAQLRKCCPKQTFTFTFKEGGITQSYILNNTDFVQTETHDSRPTVG